MTPGTPNRPPSEVPPSRCSGPGVVGTPAAFTLIELLVVIALIGILTAMIVPEMRGSHTHALLRAASRELIDVCGLAASRAVSFQQTHRILLDSGSGRYRLERRVRSAADEEEFQSIPRIPGTEGTIDSRINVQLRRPAPIADPPSRSEAPPPERTVVDGEDPEGPVRGVTFFPDGTADSIEIVLRDRDGFTLSLRINPVTARIRLREMPRR